MRRGCYPTPFPDWRKLNPMSSDIPFLAAFIAVLSSRIRLALWISLLFSGSVFIRISHLPHSVCIHYLSHYSWLDRPNTILWTVPITKPEIMFFSWAFWYFNVRGSKYCSQQLERYIPAKYTSVIYRSKRYCMHVSMCSLIEFFLALCSQTSYG
jgi:hypothetical protein